jgi:hypothetical protein
MSYRVTREIIMLCSGLVGADPLAKRVLFEFILTGLRVDRQPVLPPLAAVHDHIICYLSEHLPTSKIGVYKSL